MIQRIQTVYLFVIAILMLLTAFLPVMEVVEADGLSTHKLSLLSLGAYSFFPAFVSPVLSLLAGIMAIIAIFLYKKRTLQMNFCSWILILTIVLYATIFYSYFIVSGKDESTTYTPEIAFLFPLLTIILASMAIAGIMKDQKIVSSLDRLR